VKGDEEILASLDAVPLDEWKDKLAAVAGRVMSARAQAAKISEPKAVGVKLPSATLKTPGAFDASKSGAFLGMPALLSFCGAMLAKSLKGGLVAVGGLNLGGGIDPVHNAVSVAELALEKGATTLLIPISARRQLNELSDDMASKISILFYTDARDALIKALAD